MAVPIAGNNAYSVVSGQTKVANAPSYTHIPPYLDKYLNLSEGLAPLTTILERANRLREVRNTYFFHLEADELPTSATNSATAVSSSAVTFNLASGHGIRVRAGDILMNPSGGEQMTVTGVASDTVTVVRGHGTSSAAAIAASAQLQILPMSDTEGNTAPEGLSNTPSQKINYMQIEKESIELSRRRKNLAEYGPNTKLEEKAKAYTRMARKTEMALLFGRLDAGASNGGRPTTGGLQYWCSSNLKNIGSAALTENAWNQWLQMLSEYNQGESLLIVAGDNVLGYLDTFMHDRVQYTPGDTIFGVQVKRVRSTFMPDVSIIKHGMLSNAWDGSGTWAGYAFAINLKYLGMAHQPDANMAWREDIGANDLDGEKGYWLNDFGVWVGKERCHGILYGVSDPFA
jgi:hypothetical protein